ncbi:hypothetical protein CMMCAS04_00255 [Clavibacter michiganensis subsp. michiganensis]|nr:hypothetical protein CMMCAS04_00255 [Clavibacter michiganensis subsp. michiganensis]
MPFAEFFSQDREEVPWEAVSSYAKDPAAEARPAAAAADGPRRDPRGLVPDAAPEPRRHGRQRAADPGARQRGDPRDRRRRDRVRRHARPLGPRGGPGAAHRGRRGGRGDRRHRHDRAVDRRVGVPPGRRRERGGARHARRAAADARAVAARPPADRAPRAVEPVPHGRVDARLRGARGHRRAAGARRGRRHRRRDPGGCPRRDGPRGRRGLGLHAPRPRAERHRDRAAPAAGGGPSVVVAHDRLVLARARDPAADRGDRVRGHERGDGAADAADLHPADGALPERGARLPDVRRVRRLLHRRAAALARGERGGGEHRRGRHVGERGHPLHRPADAARGARPRARALRRGARGRRGVGDRGGRAGPVR